MPSLLSGKADKALSVSTGPHLHAAHSAHKILWVRFAALLPIWLGSLSFFGWDALRIFFVALGSGVAFEFLFRVLIGEKPKLLNGSTLLVSALLALLLPPKVPTSVILLGIFIAVIIGKEVFGGLGQNIFNPTLVGYAILLAFFPTQMGHEISRPPDGFSYLFFVAEPPILGGTSPLAIGFCGLIVLIKKWTSPEVPFVYLAAVVICSLFLGKESLYEVLDARVLLCAFFLVADLVTTPVTRGGRILFAIGAGVLFSLFHFWMTVSETIASSTLLMNATVPLLDRFSREQKKQTG